MGEQLGEKMEVIRELSGQRLSPLLKYSPKLYFERSLSWIRPTFLLDGVIIRTMAMCNSTLDVLFHLMRQHWIVIIVWQGKE